MYYGGMDWTRAYLANTMADLRHLPSRKDLPTHPSCEEEDSADFGKWRDLALEDIEGRARQYASEIDDRYDHFLENFVAYAEALEDEARAAEAPFVPPRPPSVVAQEIEHVAELRAALDAYIKSLVIFAGRGYAVEDHTQSELARLTGSTRATIARWLADEDAVEDVREVVKSQAAEAVRGVSGDEVKDKQTAMTLGLLRWYARTEGEVRVEPDRAPSAGGPIQRHCGLCGATRKHDVHLQDVECPQHLHRVNHFVCRDCGNDVAEPVGRREPDCVV